MTDKSQQSLVVVAQTGTRLSDGTMIHETDSQAVQITAECQRHPLDQRDERHYRDDK